MTDAQNREIVELYEQWSRMMVRLTFRRLHNLELAKDLVQEVFLIACCKADEMFAKGDHPKAWLFRVLENITMQERRRVYHKKEIPMENAADLPAQSTGPHLGLQELFPRTLREDEREILSWRLEQHLTYEEIAARCDATPEACRQRFSRAIRHCKQMLENDF